MPTYHQMFLGKLIGEEVRRHFWYGKEWATWPITASKGGTGQGGGSHFNDLRRRVKNPSQKGRTAMLPWISYATWGLVDQRVALGRNITSNHGEHRMLT